MQNFTRLKNQRTASYISSLENNQLSKDWGLRKRIGFILKYFNRFVLECVIPEIMVKIKIIMKLIWDFEITTQTN